MQTIPSLKTRKQIAHELGVDRKTLYNRLKKAGIVLGNGLLTPEEQNLIYQLFERKLKESGKEEKPL